MKHARASRLYCTTMIAAAVAAALGVSAAKAVTPEQIEASIQKGVQYLYSQQNDKGNWETLPTKPTDLKGVDAPNGSQWGGKTAMATYALLAAGERPLDDRIVKATEWLRTAPIDGSYAVGVRANVWLNLPTTPKNLASMGMDGRLLIDNVGQPNSKFPGIYNYQKKVNHYDMSCSQYGVLGMWAVSQRVEGLASPQYWVMIQQAWRKLQQPDGGWIYGGEPPTTPPPAGQAANAGIRGTTIQLAAAGVATLFITQDYVNPMAGSEGTQGNVSDPFITKGLAYIAANLPALIKSPFLYAMYGVERIGVASGYKYLGDVDWFQAGADTVVKRQQANGEWGDWGGIPGTAFGMLFLSRGRAPVMMNKLQYDVGAQEGNWNQRPRDVANIAKWVDTKIERHLNWQIISLKQKGLVDLHDSKILYLSGNQALAFTADQKAMLKKYIEEGGLIVGTADNGKDVFAKAYRALGKELFPDYEFKQLDEKSSTPLLAGEQFPASQWKKKMRIEAMGNTARWFMILLPEADVGKIFQQRDTNHLEAFQFFANLFLYSIDKTDARFKGDTHVVRIDPKIKTAKTIAVARLKYNGRWDPEPAGWTRLTAIMNNSDKVKLDVKTVELGKDSLDGVKVAHLTGIDKFSLTTPQRTALQDFVKKGGLLVVDACGGLDDFNAAAGNELSKMFPDQTTQLGAPIKKESPLYTLSGPTTSIPVPLAPAAPPAKGVASPTPVPAASAASAFTAQYRQYTLIQRPSGAANFRLAGIEVGGKLGVIYSTDDVSVGLVGQSVDGIIGYSPDIATTLMRRIITLKDAGKI